MDDWKDAAECVWRRVLCNAVMLNPRKVSPSGQRIYLTTSDLICQVDTNTISTLDSRPISELMFIHISFPPPCRSYRLPSIMKRVGPNDHNLSSKMGWVWYNDWERNTAETSLLTIKMAATDVKWSVETCYHNSFKGTGRCVFSKRRTSSCRLSASRHVSVALHYVTRL